MPTIQVVKVNGEKLRRLRERRLLSRAELGEKAHLDPDHIGRIERGETKTPRMANIRALVAALEVDASEFLEDWEEE